MDKLCYVPGCGCGDYVFIPAEILIDAENERIHEEKIIREIENEEIIITEPTDKP